jgi:two-component system, NarL family, response regulator DevR
MRAPTQTIDQDPASPDGDGRERASAWNQSADGSAQREACGPASAAPITLAVIDPHEVVRLGLRTLFARVANFKLVAESGTVTNGLARLGELQPDVTVTELLGWPLRGFEWIRRVRQHVSTTRIVVFSASSEDEHVMAALAEGASAYILKQSGGPALIHAVNAAARGSMVLDTAISDTIVRRLRAPPLVNDNAVLGDLNTREVGILALVAEGHTDREIAARLNLSAKTVRNYVSQILAKLGVHTRTRAAAYAIRHGVARPLLDHRLAEGNTRGNGASLMALGAKPHAG